MGKKMKFVIVPAFAHAFITSGVMTAGNLEFKNSPLATEEAQRLVCDEQVCDLYLINGERLMANLNAAFQAFYKFFGGARYQTSIESSVITDGHTDYESWKEMTQKKYLACNPHLNVEDLSGATYNTFHKSSEQNTYHNCGPMDNIQVGNVYHSKSYAHL